MGGELEEVQPEDVAAEADGQLSSAMNSVFDKVSAAEIEVPSATAEVVSFETTLEEGAAVSPAAGASTETAGAPAATEAPGSVTTDPASTEAPGATEGTETAGTPAATVTPGTTEGTDPTAAVTPGTAENPDATEAPVATQTPASDTTPGVIRFTRTVIVVAEQKIIFDAAPLHIGVEDIGYDLTTDVTAVDECDNPVEEIYVVDDSDLQAAKEMVTDVETGEEKEQYIAGSYLITLGAKHPVTEQEFFTDREVQVTNGYYIYAPVLEIETGTTQYDLLEGVELRKNDDETPIDNVEFSVKEETLDNLREQAMTDEEVVSFIEEMEERGEEPEAAREVAAMSLEETGNNNPALEEGLYEIEVEAVNNETGDVYTNTRYIRVKTILKNKNMVFEAVAYKNRIEDGYKEGDINAFYNPTTSSDFGSAYIGVINNANKWLTDFLPSKGYVNYAERYYTYGDAYQVRMYSYRVSGSQDSDIGAVKLGASLEYEIGLGRNCYNKYWYLGIWPREKSQYVTLYNGYRKQLDIDDTFENCLYTVGSQPYSGWFMKLDGWLGQNVPTDLGVSSSNVAYLTKKGDWNNLLNGDRDQQRMREGGEPDLKLTVNQGINATPKVLDFENIKPWIDNVTPESSLQVDVAGKRLEGSNVEQRLAAMQISIENGNVSTEGTAKRMNYNVPKDGWLRLKGFTTTDDLMANTEQNLRNRQMYINLSGAGTVVFDGGDDAAKPDKLYGIVENTSGGAVDVVLQTNQGAANIDTPKKFSGNSEAATYNFTVNAAQGTSIDAFNLYNIFNGSQKPANSILLGGGGTLRFNRDVNIIDATNLYSQAYAKKIELENQITVLKSGKAPVGGTVEQLPALRMSEMFAPNGNKVVAGVNKENQAAPAEKEVFAISDSNVLDPTDFTVKTDTSDGTWGSDGSWFMANADADNKQIVFIKDEQIAKTPIKVTHGSTTNMFATYKEALTYIEGQTDTAYTITNLRPMDFDEEDLTYLKSMTKTGRSIVFTGASTGAGAPTYGNCYHVRLRDSVVEMPAGYDITWNQPVKYDQGSKETEGIELTFVKNGGKLKFDSKFMCADVIRETAGGTYETVERNAYVYGGMLTGTCAKESEITIVAGKFEEVYGGNKAGSHTGNTLITVNPSKADGVTIKRLDGASRNETAKPSGRTAKIVTMSNVVLKNVYNFDELTVQSGILTIPAGNAVNENNINAQLATGYIGKTVLNDGTTLELLNNNGVRKLGSLVRSAETDTKSTATLTLGRAVDANGVTASDKNNPYLLELTAEDPLGVDSFNSNRQISISYQNKSEEKYRDIIFNLTGVKDEVTAKERYVTVRTMNSKFGMVLISDRTDCTLKLSESSLLLIDEDGNYESKIDIAGAVVGIMAKEKASPGKKYTIAIYRDGYKISDSDRKAMNLAAGVETGAFKYLEDTYTELSLAGKASQITWCGSRTSDNTETTNYTSIYPQGNLNFFGSKTVISGIKLNYTGAGQNRNLYANGSPLTVESTVSIEGTEYPNLYGGAEDGTGAAKDLTILANVTLQDVKDFRSLSIGDGGTTQTTLTIAEDLDSDPSKTDNTRTDTVYLKNAVLKFTGTAEGHIGNLEADGNSKNTINIFKDANGTKPLQLDGDLKIKDSKSPVQIALNGTAAARKDKVLHFHAKKADENKAKSIIANFITMTYQNNEYLILERSNVTWKFTTASGLAGTFNSMGATNGNSLAAEVKGESTSTTKADWNDVKGTTNNRGFVEIGADGHLTWLDEPEVKISPVAGSELRDYYWSFAHAIGDTNSIRNAFNNQTNKSSVELDFGNDGIKQLTGGRIGYTAGYPDLNGMQISYRRANIGDSNQYDPYNPRSVKGIDLISNDQVLRLDELYGNGYGWIYQSWGGKGAYGPNIIGVYAGWDNGTLELPGSIVQIRLSDTFSQNPSYQLGWNTGSIMVQSGKMVPDNEMSVVNFLNTTQVDLKDGNTVKFAGIWGKDNKNTLVEFLGTGKVYMTNLAVRPEISVYEANDLIRANTVALRDGSVSVAKGRSGLTSEIIYVKDDLITNGYHIGGLRLEGTHKSTVEKDLRENDVFARSPSQGKLDATDFVLEKPVEGTNGLYFSSKDNGMTIYVKKLATKPIQVTPAVGGVTYFDSYKLALEAIKAGGTGAEYTITNLIERDFTAEDYAALQAITVDKATGLIFESGTRADNDGAAGNRYRVRMRVQTLELPKAVNVTFQNIVMKYDQGENSEIAGSQEMVFVGNGGILKFGDGVVFLQHNDETMKPTVYGGSVNGTNDTLSTVIINSGNFKAVYGAGSVPQTKGANVSISGGSVDKVFAGGTGNGTVTGDTSITVTGGNINCPIYGGGEGAKVTGNTKVEVTGGVFDKSPDKSIYGGGKGAEVEGNSKVDITIDNSGENGKTLLCNNVSASGTDVGGNLADNVTGKNKTITITSKVAGNQAKKAALELDRLTGFDTLILGNDGETENNNFIVAIKKRFDSRVVDWATEDNRREDTVNLRTVWLKLLGDWQGHIGALNTSGKCALTIYKDDQGTRPLLADTVPTLDKNTANKVQLKASNGVNEMGDVMVTFTFREEKADDIENFLPKTIYKCFEDGLGTGLNVQQTQQNPTGTVKDTDPVDIHFAIPPAHTVASFVEYPVADGKVTLDEKGKTNQKILHFTYDKENEHNVLGGYVVAMPKELVNNETEMFKYTKTDTTFAQDGQSFSADTQVLKPVKISFTQDTTKPGTHGVNNVTVYEAHGITTDDTGNKKAIDIDNDKYWYVAHIVCQEHETYTFLLDVEAPVANTGTLKVLGSELDTKTDSYIYTVEVVDPSEVSDQKLPYYIIGSRTKKYLTYNGNGVQAGYYSLTAALNTANDTADVEASKSSNPKWNLDRPTTGAATGLYDSVEVTKRDGGKPVPGNTPARITATILRELVENNKTGAVWAYAKDELNNTVKVQIPLNDYIIDVSVPMEVNVIAVKKPNGGSTELLAPTCYVVNNGNKEITAKVSGFATTPLADLKLVEKAKTETFAADEISLFLKGTEGNVFTETNVLKVNQTPLEIGTLGKASDDTGRKKAFTFDAAYDVQNINMPDGFMKNTMSYHFSIVEGGN